MFANVIVPDWATGRIIGIFATNVCGVGVESEFVFAELLDSPEELFDPPHEVAVRDNTPTKANVRITVGFFMVLIPLVVSDSVEEI